MDERKKYTVIFEALQIDAIATLTQVNAYTAEQAESTARTLLSGQVDWRCVGVDVE